MISLMFLLIYGKQSDSGVLMRGLLEPMGADKCFTMTCHGGVIYIFYFTDHFYAMLADSHLQWL
jgi:hypothetical protein